jgi:hypothetical protein
MIPEVSTASEMRVKNFLDGWPLKNAALTHGKFI